MLLFADPADGHESSSALSRMGYLVSTPGDVVVSSSGGRTGGGYIGVHTDGILMIPADMGTAGWISFAMYVPAAPSDSSNPFVTVYNDEDGSVYNLAVRLTASGGFVLLDTAGSVVSTSSGSLWTPGQWHHVEIGMVFDVSVGGVSVKVDDLLVWEHLTANTYDEDANLITIARGVVTGGATVRIDDLCAWDATAFNDDPFVASMGDIRIASLAPVTDATTGSGWSHSGGGTFAADVASANSDSAYVQHQPPSTGPESNFLEFAHAGSPPDVGTVLAVGVIVDARRTAPGAAADATAAKTATYSPILRGQPISALPMFATYMAPAQEYTSHVSASFVDPSSNAPFSKASVDGALFGVSSESGGG